METLHPNNDAENCRRSVTGKKRSNRRSSILKTTKSPMKAVLEDIDPNSMGKSKENRDRKNERNSSSRRVSFAETYQVKEFCKDEECNVIWQRENYMSNVTDQQGDESDLFQSEYRQPTDTIRGLESLLKGDIENTEQQLQDKNEPSMDLTLCGGNTNEYCNREHLSSLKGCGGTENYKQKQDEDQLNTLEITYHDQGVINHCDSLTSAETEVYQHYYQPSGSRKESLSLQERQPGFPTCIPNSYCYQSQVQAQVHRKQPRVSCNKENETMDFTVCHKGSFDAQTSSQAAISKDRTTVFDTHRGNDQDSLELKCQGQGLIEQTTGCPTPKINPLSFLQSLNKTPCQQRENHQSEQKKQSYIDSSADDSLCLKSGHLQEKEVVDRVHAKSFLASLEKPKLKVSNEPAPNANLCCQQETLNASSNLQRFSQGIHSDTKVIDSFELQEEMDITTCLNVEATDTKTAVESDTQFCEEMDMTACVPPVSKIQDQSSGISEGHMDMKNCVPPASRLQDCSSGMSEGHMDMTTCIPPAPRLQDQSSTMSEGHMDVTTCVPPTSRLQDHSSAMSEGHMDMTACVPPASRLQNHSSGMSEGHMDMATCAPPTSRLQNHSSAMSEGHMDMTTCIPPAPRLQDHSSGMSEGHMDMTTCVPPASRLHDHFSAMSYGHMDMTACVPPASRLQDHSSGMSEGHMDMTACVLPASRLQNHSSGMSEGHMDMTACVLPASRLQDHSSAMSEGHMDMTACVPPASRLQNHSSGMSEGHMDMTTCAPPASRLQNHSSAMSEGHMDMTTCIPPAPRLQDQSSTMPEGHMDMTTCIPPASRLQNHSSGISEGHMNMTTCVSPASRLQDYSSGISEGHMNMTSSAPPTSTCIPNKVEIEDLRVNRRNKDDTDGIEFRKVELSHEDIEPISGNPVSDIEMTKYATERKSASQIQFKDTLKPQKDSRKRQTTSSLDVSFHSDTSIRKKKQLENQKDQQLGNLTDVFSYTGPVCLESLKNVGTSNQNWLNRSMPILDQKRIQTNFLKSLPLESDGSRNKSIPEATFAPVSNVPISKFCSQSARKKKMIQLDHQEPPRSVSGMSPPKFKTQDQEIANKDHKSNDSSRLMDVETVQSDAPQDYEVHGGGGDDGSSDHDAVTTFKNPMTEMPGGNPCEQQHSAVTGLMEEPKLKMGFTDQNSVSEALNSNNGVGQEVKGEMLNSNTSGISTKSVSKPQTSDLSTICEETALDCIKAASHIAEKQETAIKQKGMTVAELLLCANISFHSIEQISRRSTIAFMKKAEKPKDEKECIYLSLVKKPQAIYYEDLSNSIQQELKQLKEKMVEQELELNNSDTPILRHTDGNESIPGELKDSGSHIGVPCVTIEMEKWEIALKELKSVCKKSAYRKWITRSGGMKKKLARTLKENNEMLSNDVRTVNETLLVTNDCIKLIDGIDVKIEEGIESLAKSIKDSEKRNVEIDGLEAKLNQEKTDFESREAELKQLEDQRSSLTSKKQSLSAEKETLEREQLEHDEVLSRLKNETSLRETNENLSEVYKMLERCLEWELTEWDQNHAKFLFLYGTLELNVQFNQSDIAQSFSREHSIKKIRNISVASQLSDDSHLTAGFVHSLVVDGLNKELPQLKDRTLSLPKVLEYVAGLVITARTLGNELFEINFQHILTIEGNNIFVEFSSVKAFLKFIVHFTIDVRKFPNGVEMTVIPKIGKCCIQEIQDALTSVPTGPKYMSQLVQTARQFLYKK